MQKKQAQIARRLARVPPINYLKFIRKILGVLWGQGLWKKIGKLLYYNEVWGIIVYYSRLCGLTWFDLVKVIGALNIISVTQRVLVNVNCLRDFQTSHSVKNIQSEVSIRPEVWANRHVFLYIRAECVRVCV